MTHELFMAGFLDGLTKKAQDEEPGFLERQVVTALGQAPVALAGTGAGIAAKRLMRRRPVVADPEALIRAVAKERGIPVPRVERGGMLVEMGGPHFAYRGPITKRLVPWLERKGWVPKEVLEQVAPKAPTIRYGAVIPAAEEVLLHELGHARQAARPLGRALLAARFPGMLLGAGVPAAAALTGWDPAVKAAPYLALAGAAPTLATEAGASLFALRDILRRRGLRRTLRAAPGLAGAFGTYAGKLLAPAAGAYLLSRAYQGTEPAAVEE